LVVFGASGSQGQAVIKAFQNDKQLPSQFRIRALVHDLESKKAKKLIEQGFEVKKVDLSSRESIADAVKGATVVFAISIAEYAGAKINEFEQGKIMVDESKKAGAEQFIYGALPNAKEISGGKWEVVHFTQKHEVMEYAKKSGIKYTAFPCPPFYYENFIHFFKPILQDGEWVFNFPNTK